MYRVVYRLRQLPEDADRLEAVQLFSKALGIESSAIHVWSLAHSTDPWVPSKIATLQFSETVEVQEVLMRNAKGNISKSGDDWKIQVENLKDSLVLDSHFRGLTPLYDPAVHEADCIAISGLSSHPFGSWQPKGETKTFMWIRDALPKSLPTIRPILYGYDTTLVNSNSFQSILDLALGLLRHIEANGWESPTSKPLMFLAHSLGGIVLKQALVSHASRMQHDDPLRQAIKGVISFGVPNLGMEQSHLRAMVDGQPNEPIVADMSVNSQYLSQLDEQFTGIAHLWHIQVYWAYETRKSPTVFKNDNGMWERAGKEEILVTPHSATRGLNQEHSKSQWILPINENHSNMVKFSENDPAYSIITDKLGKIVSQLNAPIESREESTGLISQNDSIIIGTQVSAYKRRTDILESLDAPLRDNRLEQIEDKFHNTFDWVYDLQEPGFNQWLQTGYGLFWINGKPASGKSTLMKFIFKDSRTNDLLFSWRTSADQICAAFFFHYRGAVMQKSFEGLLRSVLTQILQQCPRLSSYLPQAFGNKPMTSQDWTLSRLQRGLFQVLEQDEIPFRLCLFLDALDEYDGRLEPVCKFLADLGQIPQTAGKRIQICFSSRPWDIFIREFGKVPGFSISDFTKDDIRDYCLGSIRSEHLSPGALEDLVPELVERSKGVFLWVKLVVKDLARASRIDASRQELETLLRTLPTELNDFYAEIIERIPHAHRRRAYIMLELAVRSREPLPPRHFFYALNYVDLKSHSEAVAAYDALCREYMTVPDTVDFASLVIQQSREHCGGLLEVVEVDRRGRLYDKEAEGIQVFHQSVEDFVMNPRFKTLVLGDLAKITIENGNSFLAKLGLIEREDIYNKPDKRDRLRDGYERLHIDADGIPVLHHARLAEETTGRSMKYFWGSVPAEYYANRFWAQNLLEFTVLAGLRLLLSEILAEDPEALKKSKARLIIPAIESVSSMQKPTMPRLLFGAGYGVDQDPKAFGLLVSYYWRRHEHPPINEPLEELFLDTVKLLLESGQSPEVDIELKKAITSWNWKRVSKFKALHISPLPLTEILLEHGAEVNTRDRRGRTPLDLKLRRNINDRYRFSIRDYLKLRGPSNVSEIDRAFYQNIYRVTCLLVSKGGKIRKTRPSEIRARLEEFAQFGWDTEALHRALL
ncbi:hypothetical protein G7054_g9937 [Neopestalotiopsis clavispora]|nr:hypothetical protein G7054_g9937 [Neopestalotiopsis clavispora]